MIITDDIAGHQPKRLLALLLGLPWTAFAGFLVVTLLVANTPIGDSHLIGWITTDKTAAFFFSGIALLWIFCRIRLEGRLPWTFWPRLAGVLGLCVIEAGAGIFGLLIWAAGMIGGPINPG